MMQFYSHPRIGEDSKLLFPHCYEVAKTARDLISQIKGIDADAAFWAGLFHDVGKLNPCYQNAFANGYGPRDAPSQDFVLMHAPFSALAIENCLSLDNHQTIAKAVSCIHGHHGHLAEEPYRFDNYRGPKWGKIKKVLDEIDSRLPEFWADVFQRKPELQENIDNTAKLKWREGVRYGLNTTNDNRFALFFEMNLLFSALLQSDRGIFKQWETPHFDLQLDTNKLIKKEKKRKLDDARSEFQSEVFKNNDFSGQVIVLEAPTGIGKTKMFLDIVNQLSGQRKFERVYYFSPLLALTDDFEKKLNNTLGPLSAEVLVYNHIFTGTLQEKVIQQLASDRAFTPAYSDKAAEEEENYKEIGWDFETESFNKKFIVTTTQRLLLTLFSNHHKDKLKLLSFKNSLLIVDEVQTIPRALLPAVVNLLSLFAKQAGSLILFVSATVPAALSDYPRLKTPEQICEKYLDLTRKKIVYLPAPPQFVNMGRSLIMFNTRRKAFEYAKVVGCDFYLTSGIRKADRMCILGNLEKEDNVRVVATQVVEAGVDISFDAVYRELAPLDNIVQVMGRLNREAERTEAVLTVFNGNGESIPYCNLEFSLSKGFFETHQETDSKTLLKYLRDTYYPNLDDRNTSMKNDIEKLDKYINEQKFSEVYKFVRQRIGEESFSVYIPRSEEELHRLITSFVEKKRLPPNELNNLSANFPASAFWKHQDAFNKQLMENRVYVPKEGTLDEFYDKDFGLDIWVGR